MNEARVRRWTPLRIAQAVAIVFFAAMWALVLWVTFSVVACVSSDSCIRF